ncbi:MAG: lipoate--protein ligase family protein [Nitrospirota bacterium]
MTDWRLIDSGSCGAFYNMAVDEAIALSVGKGDQPPTLRLYGWEVPSVSLGLFQRIADVNAGYCERHNIPVVRRPTGGRAILHKDELTYSFSSPNNGYFSCGLLDAYRLISIPFHRALSRVGLNADVKGERESGRNLTRSPLCFRSTSYGEISLDDEKLIGSAQKRWNNYFLQQGSIPYTVDEEALRNVFVIDGNQVNGMTGLDMIIPGLDKAAFKQAIKDSFEEEFKVRLISSGLSRQEADLAGMLEATKYRSHHWNLRR